MSALPKKYVSAFLVVSNISIRGLFAALSVKIACVFINGSSNDASSLENWLFAYHFTILSLLKNTNKPQGTTIAHKYDLKMIQIAA